MSILDIFKNCHVAFFRGILVKIPLNDKNCKRQFQKVEKSAKEFKKIEKKSCKHIKKKRQN